MFTVVLGLGPAWAQQSAPADGGVVIGLHRPMRVVRTDSAQSRALDKMRGPVHTVQEETWDYEKKPGGALAGSRYTVYDGKGRLLEDSRYGADGAVLMHTKITRDEEGRPLREERSLGDSPTRTRVNTYDNNGLATVTTYDNSGTELDKTQMHTSAAGDTTYTRHQQNEDGSTTDFKSTETTDPAAGTRHMTDSKDGRPERETLTQTNQKGETQSEAMLFFDGTSIKRETLPDGSVRSHFYNPPTKTNIYRTTDKQHRLIEEVEDGPESYTKTTYQYDEDGRPTETATFDRSGTQIGKESTKYQVDSFGNWTEKKTLGWGPKMTSKSERLLSLTKRVISYY
jgi:hypothetical protein